MTRILFVCHGNICRSPMAEFVFKKMLRDNGKEGRYRVTSAATTDEEIINGVGNPVYPPAKAELARHGISCEGKRAVQLKADDYGDCDLMIIMDSENYGDVMRLTKGDPDKKVRKLLDYCGGGDVADPWFTNEFRTAYNDVLRGCEALYVSLEGEKP